MWVQRKPGREADEGDRRMGKHRIAIFGLTAGLIGGGAAGIALGIPAIADATSSSTTTPSNVSPTDPHDTFLRDTLAPLVKNGTITQAQADAVIKALDAAHPDGDRDGRFRRGAMTDVLAAAAKKIGVSEDSLRTSLQDGTTIADVAKSKNVAVGDVVDAMVAAVKADLDQAVKDGHISQSEADAHLSDVKDHMTALVNGERPAGGPGMGGPGMGPGMHGGFGHRGGPWGGDGNGDSNGSGNSGSTNAEPSASI
jgi:hypothetical protein